MTLLRPFLAGRRKSQRTVSNSCTPNKSHCDVHHCSTRTPIYRRLNPSSKSTIRKNTSRRCVRSKPPKLMPGGRIITSGQGTLTEVSKSFYVAYGMTSLQTTDSGIHLVVPVKDELQEITDDEFEISPRTMEKPVLDFSYGSLLDSPRMSMGIEENERRGYKADTDLRYSDREFGETSGGAMNWYDGSWNVTPSRTFPSKTHYATSMDFGMDFLRDLFPQESKESFSQSNKTPATQFSNKKETDASSLPKDAKNHYEDCSYFHLAEELMPEARIRSNGQHRPLPSPRNWHAFQNRPPPTEIYSLSRPLGHWEPEFAKPFMNASLSRSISSMTYPNKPFSEYSETPWLFAPSNLLFDSII